MTGKDSAERRARGRPRAWHDKTEQNTIKSLDRAMEVLEHLSEQSGATLSQLAGDLDQSTATVYRVLVTLEGRGIVEFDPEAQTWHIGSRAFVIGARFLRRTSLVDRARPVLRHLMEQTGETANLGIERDGQVLFMSQVETHENIRAFFPPGALSPMHSSGIGKAILAFLPTPRVERIITRHGLQRFTPSTITTPAALMAELSVTRGRGYSIDAEEKNAGMRCIAAPIFDMHGEVVAGISISGPVSRMAEADTRTAAAAVMDAAHRITDGIGGSAPRAPTARV